MGGGLAVWQEDIEATNINPAESILSPEFALNILCLLNNEVNTLDVFGERCPFLFADSTGISSILRRNMDRFVFFQSSGPEFLPVF